MKILHLGFLSFLIAFVSACHEKQDAASFYMPVAELFGVDYKKSENPDNLSNRIKSLFDHCDTWEDVEGVLRGLFVLSHP